MTWRFFCFLLAVSWAAFGVTGCAHGPDTKAHGFESLNGNNYEGTEQPRPPSLPFVKRRAANSLVSGTLFVLRDGVPAPLSGERVELLRDGAHLAETRSGAAGRFQISGEIPNGRLELRVVSDRFQGTQEIVLQGFAASGIQLEAHSK